MKIGLVVPVLNNFEQAVDLVYSAQSKVHTVSTYICPQYRHQLPLAQAWNNGIREAVHDGCDYIIVSNDDVILGPTTIDDMVVEFEDNHNAVILFPLDVLDELSSPDEIFFHEGYSVSHIEDQVFSCFMIKPDFFNKCGTFDENFDPAWWEDTDMKYRIHLLGLEKIYSRAPYVHLRHQTTKKLTIPLNSQKSGEYYVRKWGSANRNLIEQYVVPYNDSALTPKDWKQYV